MNDISQFIDSLLQSGWMGRFIVAIAIVIIAALVSSYLTRLIRRLFKHSEERGLPSGTIFINVERIVVWAIALSVILSSCCGIDVNGLIATLGVVGIAVSLGFQDTISSLIGGLQLSLMGLLIPGDYVQVDATRGVVRDVTWRHTVIESDTGATLVVPNSVINKSALTKLQPRDHLRISFYVVSDGQSLDEVASNIEQAASAAAEKVCGLSAPTQVLFLDISEYGFRGVCKVFLGRDDCMNEAIDAVVRAISPYTREAAVIDFLDKSAMSASAAKTVEAEVSG